MRTATAAESRHMGRIKQMECICCRMLGIKQQSITEVHHIRQDREPRNNWLTIPLCADSCHRGQLGVHGNKSYLQILKMSEWELLGLVIKELTT